MFFFCVFSRSARSYDEQLPYIEMARKENQVASRRSSIPMIPQCRFLARMSPEAPRTCLAVQCAFLSLEPMFLLQEGGILVLVRAEVTHCEWAVKNLSNRDECSIQEIGERLSMPSRSMLLIHILH